LWEKENGTQISRIGADRRKESAFINANTSASSVQDPHPIKIAANFSDSLFSVMNSCAQPTI
jgi:hypothetical protein